MLIALIYKERSFFVFLETFLVFFSLGGIAWLATKKAGIQLRTRDGFLIIVLFWILFSIISAFPGNDSNLLIVFYVQIMPDDFVMQLHRF